MQSSQISAIDRVDELSCVSPPPRPGRETLLSRRGRNRCAVLFNQLSFALSASSSMTRVNQSFEARLSPRHSPDRDTFPSQATQITPAQAVILQYRERIASEEHNEQTDDIGQATNLMSSPLEEAFHSNRVSYSSQDYVIVPNDGIPSPIPPQDRDIKPRPDKAREIELRRARHEADIIQARSGVNGPLRCGRPGCDDILRDSRALSFHLHIHNIHDELEGCMYCGAKFETPRERQFHVCSLPNSATETFSSVEEMRGLGMLHRSSEHL